MYAQLGNIQFQGLKGFSRFEKQSETVYAEVPMINGRPRLQRTGEKLQEIGIGILLHADFCNPERELANIKDLREAGEALPLVLGNGTVLGDFVIISASESTRKTDALCNIIALELDLSIKQAVTPDRLTAIAVEAQAQAFASSIEKVVPSRPVAIQPSSGLQASALATSISIGASDIAASLETASANEGRRPAMLSKIAKIADASSIAALELAEKTRQIQQQVANATAIITAAETLSTFALDVKEAAAAQDFSGALATNSAYQQAEAALYAATATLVTLIASRQI